MPNDGNGGVRPDGKEAEECKPENQALEHGSGRESELTARVFSLATYVVPKVVMFLR